MNIHETYCLKHDTDPTVLDLAKYAAELKYIMADAMIAARSTPPKGEE